MNTDTGTAMQTIKTNIADEAMTDHIDKVVSKRHANEVESGGLVGALELAIKEIHGNVAYIYGRFGDMAAMRVLQNITDGIVDATAQSAPVLKN